MGYFVLIGVVAVAAVVILSDLFVTERRRRRTLASYFVPQDGHEVETDAAPVHRF